VWQTRRELADGREIVYFDSTPTERVTVDRRDLPATATQSQIRFDPLLGDWVTLASHRQTRTFLPPTDLCPLCPSTPDRHTEIPEHTYQVVAFENRFPSLSLHAQAPAPPARPGFGRCEVVCFTSDHDTSFAQLTPERARLVVDVWAQRTIELSAISGIQQVYCFENHGEEIGVTLAHPHGQIYAYPFVTAKTARIMSNVDDYRKRHGTNLFGEILAAERAEDTRVVTANDEWTAFVPSFARWPYEVSLYPHRQVADIPDLDDPARDAFADLYLNVLRRFARRFDTPMPYIAAWNQAPTVTSGANRDDWWLHLQLFSFRRAPGKLKYLAGSESGMGAFISDTTPEQVAAELRDVT